MSGRFVFIEGPDGVGKTTVTHALKKELDRGRQKFEFLSFPGQTVGTLGNLVYEIHHE